MSFKRQSALWMLGISLLMGSSASGIEPTGGTPDELLFVHPFLNYDSDPRWRRSWERELVRSNGLRGSVGSVTTDRFLTDIQLNLTQPVSSQFRILYMMDWLETLHLDVDEQQHFVGLEGRAMGPLSTHVLVHPTSSKAEMDFLAGLLLTNERRDGYLRISLRMEDPLFDEKNDLEASADEIAWGPQWDARYATGVWEAFSQGRYLSPQVRSFPNPGLSPDVSSTSLQTGKSIVRLRWIADSDHFVEMRAFHQNFEEESTARDGQRRSSYENQIVQLGLLYFRPLGSKLSAQLESQYVWRNAQRDSVSHRRRDLLLGTSLELGLGAGHSVDIRYMGTSFEWTTTPLDLSSSPDRDGYASKLGLGWTYRFAEATWLRASLSHEPDPQRFGGGNVQLQMRF
jgi:hypothetical protein